MRAIIQRVSYASVHINGMRHAGIQEGLLVLLGIEEADGETDVDWLASKISQLRIFNDVEGVMNRSVADTGGAVLLISQFTLFASTKKGNRPSYIRAAKPTTAIPLYERMIQALDRLLKCPVQTGVFGADMKVELLNDGPVTISIDTKQKE